MKVHATSELSAAVVVDEQAIRRLWSHVEQFCGHAYARLNCVDGIERYYDTLDSLLAFENPLRSMVRTIEVHGRSLEPEQSITIAVGRSYGSGSTLSIQGEEQEVSALQTRIMDTFSGMRAWYSPVARADLYWVVLTILLIIFLLVRLKSPSSGTTPDTNPTLVVFFFAASAVGVPVIDKIRARFFPCVSFALGQGIQRHQFNEQVRWSVIVALIIGVAASFIYAVISGA